MRVNGETEFRLIFGWRVAASQQNHVHDDLAGFPKEN
jgi:hypothetical protein